MATHQPSDMSSLEESFIILGTGPSSIYPSMSFIETPQQNGHGPTNTVVNGGSTSEAQRDSQAPESLSSFKSVVDRSKGETFAGKFLLHEIVPQQLMSSVFQQFPSINSAKTDANDVIKLYNLLDDHAQMKESLQETNERMKQQYATLLEWQKNVKDKLAEKNKLIDVLEQRLAEREVEGIKFAQEAEKKVLDVLEQLQELEKQKKDLITANETLRTELMESEERHKITIECMKSENQANIMTISEKDSIIRNIHEQIHRLETEKTSMVFVQSHETSLPQGDLMLKSEHENEVRKINRKLSQVTAENLEITDMRKMYVDEIECLKTNLKSTDELQKQMQSSIQTLTSSNSENSKRAAQAERELAVARERIDLLNAQVEIYRNDFQMEREAREKLASEKDNVMADLSLLQKRNKELIEDAQKYLTNQVAAGASAPGPATGAVRKTPPPASKENTPETEEIIRYTCPICNTESKTLRLLEQHIESCLND